jgi:hypothetical protein
MLRAVPVLLFCAACGSGGAGAVDARTPDAGTPDAGVADAGPVITIAPGCNPLVGDDCLTPFPSTAFEVAAATATGVRIELPPDTLPKSNAGVALAPDRLDQKDGFSPSTRFVVHFARGVAAADLPGQDDLAASLGAASHVQLLEHASGARVPLFAELDANALPGEPQALLIQPMVRLKPGTRYDVALVRCTTPAARSSPPCRSASCATARRCRRCSPRTLPAPRRSSHA